MTLATPLPASGKSTNDRSEPFRPIYHYTPNRNWMNDPNGLVWFDGEYHLFYQYNPYSTKWGHMSWGHAVSRDLLHWIELPVAIPEGEGMIFSGSAIVDSEDLLGFGGGKQPAIVAFYTEHLSDPIKIERQCIAYSLDRGRTFRQYDRNPLIDIGLAEFRDPKVFYHEASKAWILIVALSADHRVHIYRSNNLRDWELASTFGPMGFTRGKWECTDLLFIRPENCAAEGYWVLKIDVDNGAVGGGSGSQYFVGHFDGYAFSIDEELGSDAGQFVDFGPDFYASATWSNLPQHHDAHVLIGWMSNQQTGHFYPTDPWRGVMSIPRQLYLFEECGKLKLGQRPLEGIKQLRGRAVALPDRNVANGPVDVIATGLQSNEVQGKLALSSDAVVRLTISDESTELISITFDSDEAKINFARAQASIDDNLSFHRTSETELPIGEIVEFQLFLDRSTVEVFLLGGKRMYSACVFPKGDMRIGLECLAGSAGLSDGKCWTVGRSVGNQEPPI